ncbi:MAG: glycosyltransferase family 4 protein [Bacteroidia bacterium]|nr:glycosyltransferase family 4 protein [Bacteroidia bacterium]
MNSKLNKIAIVDLVGRGNGAMDYYDLALQSGFEKSNVDCYIYSNFKENEHCIKVFVEERKSSIQKVLNYLIGYTRALFLCKTKGIKVIILHYFQGTVQDLFPYLLSKLLGLKTIVIVHDIVSMANNDIQAMKELILIKFSDHLVVHNQFSKQQLQEVISGKRKDEISVVHHGAFKQLTDDSITREIAREKLGLSSKAQYILFFGKIKSTKGLDVLLNAMPKVNNDINLIIAGNPWKDDFEKYQSIIDKFELQHRVILNISYISDQDREYYFKACDALILPYKEIFQSGVMLMALSYSLPIVASDLESNKEIIRHEENGMLFRSEDSEDLAGQVNNLFADTKLLENVKGNCLKTIEEDYNWDKIAKQYIDISN